jgi:hypothetical protein
MARIPNSGRPGYQKPPLPSAPRPEFDPIAHESAKQAEAERRKRIERLRREPEKRYF